MRPMANRAILALAGERADRRREFTPGPLVVSGFMRETLGIGRAARLTADALERAGFDVIRHDLRPLMTRGHFGSATLPAPPGGVWLLHCNPDEAAIALASLNRASWQERYRIGYWAYELAKAPKHWITFSRNLHEVWAPSAFAASSLAGAQCPVSVYPHPSPDCPAELSAAPQRASDAPIHFLAFADLRSSATRKNPMGAINAFQMAFPEASDQARLTVKLVRPDADPKAVNALEELASQRPDIVISMEDLSDTEVLGLIARCDVLISLHRSEGFGLAILEAMMLGRAVIATGWSGNLEFMSTLPEALVPYKLIPVNDPSDIYRQNAQWADPDLEKAAQLLRRLAKDDAFRSSLAAAGQKAAAQTRTRWSREALAQTELAKWVAPAHSAKGAPVNAS